MNNFTDAVIENRDWSGTDLAGADFTRARLSDCRFDGANLADAVFDEAQLENESMRAKAAAPRNSLFFIFSCFCV